MFSEFLLTAPIAVHMSHVVMPALRAPGSSLTFVSTQPSEKSPPLFCMLVRVERERT